MMNTILSAFWGPQMSETVVLFLFKLTIKATLLLILAMVIAKLMRRSSAASRHLVWSLALAGVLILPVLRLFMPIWEVVMPDVSRFPKKEIGAAGPWKFPVFVESPESQIQTSNMTSQLHKKNKISTNSIPPNKEGLEKRPTTFERSSQNFSFRENWKTLLPIIWVIGVLAIFVRQLFGRFSLLWLVKKSETGKTSCLSDLADELRQRLDIHRQVKVLRSTRATMPMT